MARWSALIVGFLGVLHRHRSGRRDFQVGALFALANAMMYGTVDRGGARHDGDRIGRDAADVSAVAARRVLTRCCCRSAFVMPTWFDALLMLVNGVTNAAGQYWWTRALHLAPASAVTPFYISRWSGRS